MGDTMLNMDKMSAGEQIPKVEGFQGQRMFVLPRPLAAASLQRPLTKHLLVTDAGFFPHASSHGRTRPEGAKENILLVCTDGQGWCRIDGETLTIRRGDALVIEASQAHTYGASQTRPWSIWWFHFLGRASEEIVTTAHASAGGRVTHLRNPAPIASLISQVIDGLDLGTAGGLIQATGAAWGALTTITASGRRTSGPGATPIEKAVEHLRATTPQRTSVDTLASMVGLSPSRFRVLFRHEVGMSPMQYQDHLRMALARDLLDGTDLAIQTIAAEAGFDDSLYFSRRFKKAHHLSPTEYRARPR